MQILIVENSSDVIRMLTTAFGAKYRLKVASSLRVCLEILQTAPLPDVILLDLQLDDVSGFTAVTSLQDQYPQIPIVVLTGTLPPDMASMAIEMGAQDYLTKPIHLDTLEDALKKAVARHRVRRSYAPLQESLRELKEVQSKSSSSPSIKPLQDIPPKSTTPSKGTPAIGNGHA